MRCPFVQELLNCELRVSGEQGELTPILAWLRKLFPRASKHRAGASEVAIALDPGCQGIELRALVRGRLVVVDRKDAMQMANIAEAKVPVVGKRRRTRKRSLGAWPTGPRRPIVGARGEGAIRDARQTNFPSYLDVFRYNDFIINATVRVLSVSGPELAPRGQRGRARSTL